MAPKGFGHFSRLNASAIFLALIVNANTPANIAALSPIAAIAVGAHAKLSRVQNILAR